MTACPEFRTGLVATASRAGCCTRPSTGTPRRFATGVCWSSALAHLGMEIAFDLVEAAPPRSGFRLVRRPTSSCARGRGASRRRNRAGDGAFSGPVCRRGRSPRTQAGYRRSDRIRVAGPDEGVFARLRRLGVAPAIVDKEVIEAIKERRFEACGKARVARRHRSTPGRRRTSCAGRSDRGDGLQAWLEPLVGHLGYSETTDFQARSGSGRPPRG